MTALSDASVNAHEDRSDEVEVKSDRSEVDEVKSIENRDALTDSNLDLSVSMRKMIPLTQSPPCSSSQQEQRAQNYLIR